MIQNMLSTIDNPYNPFSDYDDWYAWDARMGYHTPSFLARIVTSSPELSNVDQNRIQLEAIDEIVRENVLGIYIKVSEDSENK